MGHIAPAGVINSISTGSTFATVEVMQVTQDGVHNKWTRSFTQNKMYDLNESPILLQMRNLEELPADVAMTTRDERGNTVLHRCVELGNPDAVYMILDRFPVLSSDMNTDNMTAIELAVKVSFKVKVENG